MFAARTTLLLLGLATLATTVLAKIQYSDVGMLCLVNKERRKQGLKPLGLDPKLTQAARKHSQDQARRRKMSHTGGDGSRPSQRVSRAGFKWKSTAENVAYGYKSMEEVMRVWMKSPGHRKNILSRDNTMFGSGVAYSGNTPYFTQTFASDGSPARNVPKCDGSDKDGAYGQAQGGDAYGEDMGGDAYGDDMGGDDYGSSKGGNDYGNDDYGSSKGGKNKKDCKPGQGGSDGGDYDQSGGDDYGSDSGNKSRGGRRSGGDDYDQSGGDDYGSDSGKKSRGGRRSGGDDYDQSGGDDYGSDSGKKSRGGRRSGGDDKKSRGGRRSGGGSRGGDY